MKKPQAPNPVRQGDLLFIYPGDPSYRKPTGKLTRQAPKGGRCIVARGEATGHHHSFNARVGVMELDEGGVTYLTLDQLTKIKHQEHAPAVLNPDKLIEVRRQTEWTDANEPRQVLD